MMQDKRILAVVGVIVLLLIAGASFMLLGRNAAEESSEEEESVSDSVATLSPEEVGLEMEALSNNQQVIFRLTNPEGIDAVEYELTYVAEDEQQRGVIGTIDDLDTSGGVIESKPLDLGSCSSGVCKYDRGVESVDLLLKVTKGDKDYVVKDSLNLE